MDYEEIINQITMDLTCNFRYFNLTTNSPGKRAADHCLGHPVEAAFR
jgi:hypothetical protein